jgi:hypothetical protein
MIIMMVGIYFSFHRQLRKPAKRTGLLIKTAHLIGVDLFVIAVDTLERNCHSIVIS